MSKRSKKSPLSYSDKRNYIRQFDQAPSGKLTPATKAKITKLYKKYSKFDNNQALSFHRIDREKRKQLKRSGYIVTNKGAWIPQRKREQITVLKSGIKHSSQSRAVKREEYEFPLSKNDVELLLKDIPGFLDSLASQHSRIFDSHKGARRYYRLVWSLGSGREELTLLKLESYIRRVQEEAIRSTKRNVNVLSKKERTKRFKKTVIAIRIIFITSKQKRKKKK